jgi:hypothetical protein
LLVHPASGKRYYECISDWLKNVHFGVNTNQFWNIYAPINWQFVSVFLLIQNG